MKIDLEQIAERSCVFERERDSVLDYFKHKIKDTAKLTGIPLGAYVGHHLGGNLGMLVGGFLGPFPMYYGMLAVERISHAGINAVDKVLKLHLKKMMNSYGFTNEYLREKKADEIIRKTQKNFELELAGRDVLYFNDSFNNSVMRNEVRDLETLAATKKPHKSSLARILRFSEELIDEDQEPKPEIIVDAYATLATYVNNKSCRRLGRDQFIDDVLSFAQMALSALIDVSEKGNVSKEKQHKVYEHLQTAQKIAEKGTRACFGVPTIWNRSIREENAYSGALELYEKLQTVKTLIGYENEHS